MTISMRRLAAVGALLAGATLLLATTPAIAATAVAAPATPTTGTPGPDAVAAASARFSDDPEGAIAALQALRADPAGADYAAAGPPLLTAYLKQRRLDEANALATQLLDEPATDPAREVQLLNIVLDVYFATGDWAAVASLESRVQAAAKLETVPAAARAGMLHGLAAAYTRIPRFDDALAVLDTMLALLGDTPSDTLVDTLRTKGAVHAMQGQFPPAIEALRRAEQVLAELGRPADTGILRNLAGIFINLGEFDRAIEYAARAEQVQRDQPPTPVERLGILSILATAHIAAGHFEEGRRWSLEAIDFGRENGLAVTSVQSNYATLLRDEGHPAEALAIYRDLITQVGPQEAPELRGVLEKNIGETLVALGRRDEAATHLQQARELYETADVRPKRLELYPVLIDNLDALGRSAEALAAMREFKALSDETISTESQTRIGELEAAIDLERNRQALAEAEAANELQRAANLALQAEQARARAINLALLASLVAVAAVLALLWRTHRLRSRSHAELTVRNVEIEQQRSALESLNASIHQQSREDALTGLGNRRRLLEAMTEAPTEPSLLVMADLDHFKQINDVHGHDIGDRALRLFADALRAVARSGDVLVRWGGEEFVWVIRGARADQGPALCERLLRQLREQPMDIGGQPLRVSASLGFVPLPLHDGTAADWESALRIADYAVYCTKGAGRDGWTGFASAGQPDPEASPAAMEAQGSLRRIAPGVAA